MSGLPRTEAKNVRMVEVALAPAVAAPALVTIAVGDASVSVEVGTDPKYVSALVAALRSSC